MGNKGDRLATPREVIDAIQEFMELSADTVQDGWKKVFGTEAHVTIIISEPGDPESSTVISGAEDRDDLLNILRETINNLNKEKDLEHAKAH